MSTKIVDKFQVAPSSGAPTEQLLKLLHLDIALLPIHPLKNLIFYSFQCSESHFLETIVPSLKKSLSLTLKHFPPLAGKIIFPLTSHSKPVSHYVSGHDSFSLTTAISNAGFENLTGNHSKNADQFHDFAPHLPPANYSPDFIKFSVAAIQITLFPNQGLCIGFTHHHAIGDGATLVRFVQTWASINKFNGEDHLLALSEKCLPFYGRDILKDADQLATECWENMKISRPTLSSTVSSPTYRVRRTFVVSEAEIKKLKNFFLNKKRAMDYVSSFVVACAHLWTCLAKSAAAAGEDLDDDEPQYLTCAANCRGRINPPLPDTYFGNCVTIVLAQSTNGELKKKDGFFSAAEAIGMAIQKALSNEKGIMDGSVNLLIEGVKRIENGKVVRVVGLPRFDLYAADYGWGRPEKFEALLDRGESVCICKSRDFEGGIEIGLSMPEARMDFFERIFNEGLRGAIVAENVI